MTDRTILLDLGNVVIGVDFRRVFAAWAEAAQVDQRVFYERWQLDAAYKAHEVGTLDFEGYCAHLSRLFGVDMPLTEWQRGWNDLWTEPFHDVIDLLPELAARYDLYAFTNTNDTHAECWRELFGHKLTPFQDIFVSSEIGKRKPDIEAYDHVCEVMNTNPGEVLFLDDTRENIDGARATGIDARWVQNQGEVVRELKSLLR